MPKHPINPTLNPVSDKASRLLSLIATGLQLHAEQTRALTLGDRSQYIGLSDIGRALECPRAAVLRKTMPQSPQNLQKLLTLERGHWLEHGIGQALRQQHQYILPQLEIAHSHNHTPVKAHVDFALVWDSPRPAVRILELKSTATLPETLYTAYETQLYGQVGLLAECWSNPAFSMRSEDGTPICQGLTFPELMQRCFGVTIPQTPESVDIEAWVLCVSMDNAKAFGPYIQSTQMLALCMQTAEAIWESIQEIESGNLDITQLPYAKGYHALCGYCEGNAVCPKFHDEAHLPEWGSMLDTLALLKDKRTNLEAEIEAMEQEIKALYSNMSAKDWLSTGNWRFRVSMQEGRKSINKDALRAELASLSTEDTAEGILARAERVGASFSRLYIQKMEAQHGV